MAGTVTIVVDTARLDELIRKIPNKKVVRILHDGVDYGIHQELGTTKMAAQPFMTPAAEAVRQPFLGGLKQLSNLERIETFVEKVAYDALGVAHIHVPVDTGLLKSTLKVSKPEDIGL